MAQSQVPLEAGARATLSVRPDAVRVTASTDPGAAPAGLRGQVAEIIYLGNRTRVQAATPDEEMILADLRDEEAQGLERGAWVMLAWNPGAASAWAGGPKERGA